MCVKRNVISEAAPPVQEVKATKSLKMLQKYKTKHNIVTDPTNMDKQKEVEYQPDLLAVSTQLTKVIYDIAMRQLLRFKNTKAYT